ncbi:hypothetical protein GJ496_010808, partial [Pomphorhynchus laevis]
MISRQSIEDVFATYNEIIERQSDIVDKIKDQVTVFYKELNLLQSHFQRIHTASDRNDKSLFQELEQKLPLFSSILKNISEAIPDNSINTYRDLWRNAVQQLICLMVLSEFLIDCQLITHVEICKRLQVSTDTRDFHIDIEDYLCGLLFAGNELSRLAINSVTAGDLQRPKQIHEFLDKIS